MEVVNVILGPVGQIVPKLPPALFSLLIGMLLIKVVIFFLRHSLKVLKFPTDLRGLIISLSKVGLWILLVIYLASILGLDKLALAISGSALVLVFFLNNSAATLIGDLVAGFFLIGDPDFEVGMRVVANEGKTEGVITSIDMRKVRVIDDSGNLHILPNSIIEKGEWTVLERKEKKRRLLKR